jgi:hypothetical protein
MMPGKFIAPSGKSGGFAQTPGMNLGERNRGSRAGGNGTIL